MAAMGVNLKMPDKVFSQLIIHGWDPYNDIQVGGTLPTLSFFHKSGKSNMVATVLYQILKSVIFPIVIDLNTSFCYWSICF